MLTYSRLTGIQVSQKLYIILWLTFIGTTLVAMPSVAMAFHYSTNGRGDWTDPDFWFLLQSSSMQFCGLSIMALTLSKDAYGWSLVPIWAALGCTIAGPSLYCEVPTQYSALLNCVAGVVQAFVILQGSLAEHGK